jgi:hypothetical protein
MMILTLLGSTALIFMITISLVVIAQEVSILLSIALFAVIAYMSVKLLAKRLTRL